LSGLQGREQKVCRFLFLFKKQLLVFNCRGGQKNFVTLLRHTHAKSPSIAGAIARYGVL
jgi:hypothetical protein